MIRKATSRQLAGGSIHSTWTRFWPSPWSLGSPPAARRRPVWYLWEDGAFWWITGSYARLPELGEDPRVALVVDTCDLKTLEVLQVTARGEAEVVPFDEARARRKLVRYLGDDEHTWPRDFREFGPDTRFVRFVPNRLIAIDLSKVRPA